MQDKLTVFFEALTEASQWDLFLQPEEKDGMTYTEARRRVIERIFAKFQARIITPNFEMSNDELIITLTDRLIKDKTPCICDTFPPEAEYTCTKCNKKHKSILTS